MLKVKFWRIENVVVMKVLEQPENIRNKGYLFDHEGFSLRSDNSPEIEENTCYVRGYYDDKDEYITCYEFDNSSHAYEWIRRATKTIAKYNESISHDKDDDKDDVEITIAM